MKRILSPLHLLLALLFALVVLPAAAAEPTGAGTRYELVEGGEPWQPLQGKIEVAEVFAYQCHHCANFAPMVEAWKRKQPKQVRVSYVPLPYSADDAFARGFFATQAAGTLDKVHAALFEAVHKHKTVPSNPSIAELSAWYGQRGLKAANLAKAMEAPATTERLTAARQFAVRSGVEGTPTLIINGRYRIIGSNFTQILANADAVIAQLRAPAGTAR